MPLKLSWDERRAEAAEGPVRLREGAPFPSGATGSVAASEAVGCGFDSRLGICSGVGQWQAGGL
jgi:hypothetical protein